MGKYDDLIGGFTVTIDVEEVLREEEQKGMDEKKIAKLYELLERIEGEDDEDTAAALRWAILQLDNK